MKIMALNSEERRTCFGLYRNNDLFRHFMPILSEVERQFTGVDAISLWHHADRVLQKLRAVQSFRDTELDFLHAEMARENDAKALATVMFVVFIRLANAADTGTSSTPNDPISIAILKLYHEDAFFLKLVEAFFRNKVGNNGKKVVIAPFDPMTQALSMDEVDEVAKSEMEGYVKRVTELTQGLMIHFKEKWNGWELLWRNICMDTELFTLLKEINPNRNDWELNQKMICNVVGLCVNQKILETSVSSLNKALTAKQVSSYISQPKDFGGSNTVFTKEQCDKVTIMIKNQL